MIHNREYHEYAHAIPLAWQLLLGVEAEPKVYTKEQKEKLKKRLEEIGDPKWNQVELRLEKKQIENILRS